MSAPKRIQRKRTKGWRMPDGAVIVDRSTKWGNPFPMSPVISAFPSLTDRQVAQFVVNDFRTLIERGSLRPWPLSQPDEWVTYPSVAEIRAELAGKDLACWCPLVDDEGNRFPCHADVLLEIANRAADTEEETP